MTAPAFQTIVFCALQLFAAWLIYALRPGGRPASIDYFRLRAALPAVALLTLFALAEFSDNGQGIRVAIDTLRAPLAGPPGQTVFIAGEQPANSDLVIPPYIDSTRSAEVLGPNQRRMFWIETTAAGASACVRNVPASANGLPGWSVSTDPNKKRKKPLADGCNTAIGEAPIQFWISRVDPGDTPHEHHLRRSFTVAREAAGGAVVLKLDGAIRADAGTCNDPHLRLMPSVPLPRDASYVPAADLAFAAIGRGGDHPLLDTASLGAAPPGEDICARKDPVFSWPSADMAQARLLGNVHRPFVPWFPLFLVAVTSLLLYWLREDAWISNRVEGNLVFLVQWLLTMRIMIGAAGIFNDLDKAVAPVLLDIMAAYVCLPFIAVAMVMRGGPDTRAVARGMLAYLAIAGVAMAFWLRSYNGAVVPSAIALMTAGLLEWRARSASVAPLLTITLKRAVQLAKALATLPVLRGTGPAGLAAAIIVVLTACRVVLWGVGQIIGSGPRLTEHLGPLPLSLVHVPILIAAFALLLAAIQLRTRHWWYAIPALAALTYYAINVVVHDFGGILVYAWPVGMVMAWFGVKPLWAAGQRLASVGVLLTALAPFLIFVLAWTLGATKIPAPDSDHIVEHMESAVDWDANFIRLLRYWSPEKVESVGNRAAFENMDQAASLKPLVAGIYGHGYLEPSRVHNPLLRYQYSDNLSAVHLMWPFGRIGVVCLLIFVALGVQGFVPKALPDASEGLTARAVALIATMAGMTIVWADIYMVMANLFLVPFTGRNVYLLAATSGGDLAEGMVLLLMMCLPWLSAEPGDVERAA